MLILSIFAGLSGSLGMFFGDMLLYFTKGRYDMDGTLKPYAGIMKEISEKRVLLGGILGPVCSFLYACGFLHLYFIAIDEMRTLAIILTLLLSFALIIGGAYHGQWTMLALSSKYGNEKVTDKIINAMMCLGKLYGPPYILGSLGIAVMIIAGWTALPRFFVVFTPIVTLFLDLLWMKVPQPLRVILFGGWYNLVFVIYYSALLIWMLC